MMIKKMLVTLTMCSGMVFVSGCSSIMSHTGGKEGTYPRTRASATMISESDTNWGTKSLAILDMPFTAVLDTVLLPWDLFRKDNSVRSRVEKSEERTQPRTPLFPRQKCLLHKLTPGFSHPQLAETLDVFHPRNLSTIREKTIASADGGLS